MKFKAGDVVIVKKPKDTEPWPSWVNSMNVFDGTVQTLSDYKVYSAGEVAFCFEGDDDYHLFNIKWLIPHDDTPFEGNI